MNSQYRNTFTILDFFLICQNFEILFIICAKKKFN
jgi:hypothetical protein